MSKQNARHVSTNIPSTRTAIKSPESVSNRRNNIEFINYNALDASRKEIIFKEQKAYRTWTEKYDPWLIYEYRQMYDNMAKVHGISRENHVMSLKRTEWQQPANIFPPLNKYLSGQRRRRVFGAFPETENDASIKIGWRVLPQHAIEVYERTKMAHLNPLPKKYKFSNWPIESFY